MHQRIEILTVNLKNKMANQFSLQDPNQNHTLMVASGTAGTAETRRVIADEEGNIHVKSLSPLAPKNFDNISVSYTNGTTEAYVYKSGTVPVGTVTVVYLDTGKGSISTVTKS
jgi:hypothetical protein